MYLEIQNDLKARIESSKGDRPLQRRPNLGKALRQILRRRRIKTKDFAKMSGIIEGTLNTMMHHGEINTRENKLLAIVKALDMPLEDFIWIAEETAPYNFYLLGKNEVPLLKYPTHEVEVYSPPQISSQDFIWCLIRLYPGQKIENLIFRGMDSVMGKVTHGYLDLTYGEKSHLIHPNQCFLFDPMKTHSFKNMAPHGTTDFFLLFRFKSTSSFEIKKESTDSAQVPFSVTQFVRQVRKELSLVAGDELPTPYLSYLSGIEVDALNHLQFREGNKEIPFEKLDLLSKITRQPLKTLLQKTQNRYPGRMRIYTEEDKFMMDLSLRYGLTFTNNTGIGTGEKIFSIAELSLNAWKFGEMKKAWHYTGPGFLGVKVNAGILGVQYGAQPPKTLKWGDSFYSNSEMGITLENMIPVEKANELGESPEVFATVFSSPPLF
ncbi:MAG: helix-turn-helix domain-containing protein [Candidatus Omnitrophica bacterium]|nr:helix-turn-helix domain-containing protein [Candidatus Omnitrophota bacterium]